MTEPHCCRGFTSLRATAAGGITSLNPTPCGRRMIPFSSSAAIMVQGRRGAIQAHCSGVGGGPVLVELHEPTQI